MLHRMLDWALENESRKAWLSQHGLKLVIGVWFFAGVVWTLATIAMIGVLS